MRLLVLIFAGLVNLAVAELRFFPRQQSDNLNITCTLNNISSVDLCYVVSIVISKSQNGTDEILASTNSFGNSTNHVPEANVYGRIADTSQSPEYSITLGWHKASFLLNGNYECSLYGLDSDNQARKLAQTLTLALQDTDPIIQVTPLHIQDGLTPSLMVDCSLTNLAVYNASQVLRVEINHVVNQVSRLLGTSSAGTQLIVPRTGWSLVSNFLDPTKSLYLALGREQPTVADAGTYNCQVFLESTSTPSVVRSASVAASASSQADVYKEYKERESLQDYFLFFCNFEHGLCGLTPSVIGPYDSPGWTLLQDNILGHGLHSEGGQADGKGHYLFLFSNLASWDNHFIIETPEFAPIGRHLCLSFWLLIRVNVLDLLILTNQTGVLQEVWSYPGFGGRLDDSWSNIRLELEPRNQPFSLVFQAVGVYHTTDALLAIDDIFISDLNCP